MTQTVHRAFTLIELLVVITIIVVLLALLAPALDQAVYQAELAACGARLKAVGSGFTLYAMDHARRYPHRPRTQAPAVGDSQHWIRATTPENKPDDLRARVARHISVNKMLQCPFTKGADLEGAASTSQVFSSYQLWAGWQFTFNGQVQPAMIRLGDQLGFEADRFDVLASDVLANEPAAAQVAHPDFEGGTVNRPYQDELVAPYFYTFSLWLGRAGTIDRQFAYSDGSVRKFQNVQFEADAEGTMVYLPWRANSAQFPQKGTYLPKR